MINENSFNEMPAQHYYNIKKKLCDGDLIFCSGNSLISNLIKEATSSAVSHVGLLLQLPVTGQWLVLESVEDIGVRCVTLQQGYLCNYDDSGKAYDGKIVIARHKWVASRRHSIKKLYQRAFDLVGDKYSKSDIFKIASRIALNKVGIHEDGQIYDNNRYICSEYVYACLQSIGIRLPYNKLGFVSPADLAGSDDIEPLFQLALTTSASIDSVLIPT